MTDKIKSAGIIGAGALGLLFAVPFRNHLGRSFRFIAEGSRYRRLKETEFVINGKPFSFRIEKPGEHNDNPDLILLAVKNNHLENIVPILEKSVTKDTIIISVLNGIDSEEFLETRFPMARIIYTVALGMDAVKEGNRLTYSSTGKLLIGRKDNNREDPALKTVEGFLNKAGIPAEIPEDIHRSIWWKWMINIGVNQVSAVTGASYGVFKKEGEARNLMDAAMLETVEVAKAAGVALKEEDITDWYEVLNGLGPEGKTSMLQDMEAGRISEAPWFGGTLISLGKKYSIPVPVNQTLYRIIKTKESLF